MSEFQAQCDTFRQGFCDGTKRLRCAACGGWGHGNCYGNGSGALEVPCEHVCPGREAAREDARDEVVQAAVAWVEDDSWANRTALRAAVAAYEKLAGGA